MTASSVRFGTTSDYSDLSDEVTFGLVNGSFSAPTPARGARTRIVSFMVEVDATPTDLVWDAIREIETQINRATAYRDRRSNLWVELGVQLADSSTRSYFSVLGGVVELLPASIDGVALEVGKAWVNVSLVCLAALRTDTVSVAVSGAITQAAGTPATPGNAGVGGLYLADIPGDEPAPCRIRLIDGSGGSKVISRVRIGVFSRANMSATALKAWIDQTTVSPGTSETTETNRVGSNYAELVCDDTWQAAASFTGGTDPEINSGEVDVFARMWSNAGTLSRPTGLAGTQNSSGSLSTGSTYQIKVTTLDGSGNETDASDVISKTVAAASQDRIALTWTVNGSGAADHRIYVKKDSDDWVYQASGSGTGAYNLDTLVGATTADPPSVSEFAEPYARLAYGDTSLAVVETTPGVQLQSGPNPVMAYLTRAQLPPVPFGEGESGEQWKAQVQFVTGILGSNQTARVDALVIMPPWPQVTCEYTGLDLATQCEWWIETRRDGRTFCQLRSKADQTAQGWAACVGELYLPPGDCLLVVIADIAAGVHDATNTSLTMQVDYMPMWRQFRGSV